MHGSFKRSLGRVKGMGLVVWLAAILIAGCGDNNSGFPVWGPPGVAGADGKDGTDGATGAQGEQGEPGEQGETGPTGPVGPSGPAGQSGLIGILDPCGDDAGYPDEVLLKFENNTIIAIFTEHGQNYLRQFACGTEGYFITVDHQGCVFKLDGDCEVTYP